MSASWYQAPAAKCLVDMFFLFIEASQPFHEDKPGMSEGRVWAAGPSLSPPCRPALEKFTLEADEARPYA